MIRSIIVGGRGIGPDHAVYVVAEMSANHNRAYDQAIQILEAAKEAGADAVKLQTYTPDTITINSDDDVFRIGNGTPWQGRSLYGLLGEAYTPWDWQPKLKKIADDLEIQLFSTAYDDTAVDFLEEMAVPAYKVASFEVVDLPLLRRVAKTGKPIIMSTGMATLGEVDEAVRTLREAGAEEIALLKCTSAYPARPEEMNLRAIPHLSEVFGVPAGLSDHTLSTVVPVAAVALGACIVEKHLTLSRETPGPDTAFSLEPQEFKSMVDAIRTAEKALGEVRYETTEREAASRLFRRSLFVVKDMKKGEAFTEENVRSIRPGHGLHTRYLSQVLERRASCDIPRGTPLSWDLVGGSE